jgi:hypothetical protein
MHACSHAAAARAAASGLAAAMGGKSRSPSATSPRKRPAGQEGVQLDSASPPAWYAFWQTNGGAKGSKNMPSGAAVRHWITGGIEAWNYIYLVAGLIIYFFMCPLSRAATLEWDWVAFVVLRNIAMYWITFGGTHHLLYISAARHDLVKKGLKFNPSFPGDGSKLYPEGWAPLLTTLSHMLTGRGKELHRFAQHSHDCFMVHVSCLISSALEVYFLHGWATGRLPLMPDSEVFGAYSLGLMFILPFFRNAHFYATVRRALPPGLSDLC